MISVVEKVSDFDRMVSSLAIVLRCLLLIIIAAKDLLLLFLLIKETISKKLKNPLDKKGSETEEEGKKVFLTMKLSSCLEYMFIRMKKCPHVFWEILRIVIRHDIGCPIHP